MNENVTLKIVAVIVTYNRKELLLECINKILSQTYKLYKIIIIDNSSTDGTMDLLKEKKILNQKVIDYRMMDRNLGGAGGFCYGIEAARNLNPDWIWIMDDDAIPYDNTLEMLVKHIQDDSNTSFLASCVKGEFGEPMNVPKIDDESTQNGYSDWYINLDRGLIKIQSATFVSLLINNYAVKKCGLPCKDYFIWGGRY